MVKNAPILLAQLETGHMSVALMRGRQAKQSPNLNIHSTSTTAYMSKRGKQKGGALYKIVWNLNYMLYIKTLGCVRQGNLLIQTFIQLLHVKMGQATMDQSIEYG